MDTYYILCIWIFSLITLFKDDFVRDPRLSILTPVLDTAFLLSRKLLDRLIRCASIDWDWEKESSTFCFLLTQMEYLRFPPTITNFPNACLVFNDFCLV